MSIRHTHDERSRFSSRLESVRLPPFHTLVRQVAHGRPTYTHSDPDASDNDTAATDSDTATTYSDMFMTDNDTLTTYSETMTTGGDTDAEGETDDGSWEPASWERARTPSGTGGTLPSRESGNAGAGGEDGDRSWRLGSWARVSGMRSTLTEGEGSNTDTVPVRTPTRTSFAAPIAPRRR